MPKFLVSELNKFLVCSLCDGYFREATTSVECLHTFCKECLEQSFKDQYMANQKARKACPTCEIDLGLNPMERDQRDAKKNPKCLFDRNLQACVDKIFPQFSLSEERGTHVGVRTKASTIDPVPTLPPDDGCHVVSAEEGGENDADKDEQETKRQKTCELSAGGAYDGNGTSNDGVGFDESKPAANSAAETRFVAKVVEMSITLQNPADASKLPESNLKRPAGITLKMPLKIEVVALRDFLKGKGYISKGYDIELWDAPDESAIGDSNAEGTRVLKDDVKIETVIMQRGFGGGADKEGYATHKDTGARLKLPLQVHLVIHKL